MARLAAHPAETAQANILRAECRGETCTFFVNDEWTWQAESIAATSQVGVVAAGPGAALNAQKSVFDHFALQSP